MLTHSKREEYGIRFVTRLAKAHSGKPLSLAIIADEEKLAVPFLRQIALDLRHAGLLTAIEGKNGGYQLAKEPSQISVADVIEAVVKRKLLSCCNPRGESSYKCKCKNEALWKKLNKYYIRNLYKITLDKLC